MPCIFPHVARISFNTFLASDAGTGLTHESGWALGPGTVCGTGEAVRGGCLIRRWRFELDVRGGGCEAGEAMEGWPIEVTTASSIPWKLAVAVECTEPMRCRLVTKRFGGDRSLVERSSSVLVLGRVPVSLVVRSEYSVSLEFARATNPRGLFVLDAVLPPERGEIGGELA